MIDIFFNLKMIWFTICFFIVFCGLLSIMIKDKRNHSFMWIKYIPLMFFC